VGKLVSGLEFDNSYRNNQPIVVNLSTGLIIKGWKDGIPGMRVGGKRRLTIPPELAYGKTGHPPMIGPDAMLVFDIELLDIVK
jgi:FKBP-type peptidyl-prolyl cis-trans isomerase